MKASRDVAELIILMLAMAEEMREAGDDNAALCALDAVRMLRNDFEEARPRGRPKGTGYNDETALALLDVLAAEMPTKTGAAFIVDHAPGICAGAGTRTAKIERLAAKRRIDTAAGRLRNPWVDFPLATAAMAKHPQTAKLCEIATTVIERAIDEHPDHVPRSWLEAVMEGKAFLQLAIRGAPTQLRPSLESLMCQIDRIGPLEGAAVKKE